MAAPTVSDAYNARAAAYDDKSTFHRHLASEYVKYAKPQPNESLLDLACGTGLVVFEFAPILQSSSSHPKPKIVGVDISPGMLDVARSKLSLSAKKKPLSHLPGARHREPHHLARVRRELRHHHNLLRARPPPRPASAVAHWATYLKAGGWMVVDVPHTRSMLALKVLDTISAESGIEVLGRRTWIECPESLKRIIEDAGLETSVLITEVFDDIPARTEEGRTEWRVDEGGQVWDRVVIGKGMKGWCELGEEEGTRTRSRFQDEWAKLAGADGCVREEGRLFVGIGVRR